MKPVTRKEKFLKALSSPDDVLPSPITREEMYLDEAVAYLKNLSPGGGGDVTKQYVDEHLALKQNIRDTNLKTNSKEVVGAINELNTEKANTDGFYEGLTVGHAIESQQIVSDRQIEDAEEACPPITFGTIGGNAEVQDGYSKFEELRGNTILWNQLIDNGDFATGDLTGWEAATNPPTTATVSGKICTLSPVGAEQAAITINKTGLTIKNGHTYLFKIEKDTSGLGNFSAVSMYCHDNETSMAATNNLGSSCIFTAGMDANRLRIRFFAKENTYISGSATITNVQMFDITSGTLPNTEADFNAEYPQAYYDYNAGQLLSSKSATLIVREKNQFSGLDTFIPVLPGTEYELSGITDGSLVEYDCNKTLIKTTAISATADITLSADTHFVKIQATTYTNIMFYIAYAIYNEPYEAYEQQIVTLPNLELRSLGNVYDVAYQSGGGKRRIGYRDYESGDESDSNVLTDGTHTIYVLAEETDITEVENPGWAEFVKVDNFGTLQFTTDPVQIIQVPQAYFIKYTVNLTEFLDSLYVEAGGDPTNLKPTVKSISAAGTALTPDANGNVNIPKGTGGNPGLLIAGYGSYGIQIYGKDAEPRLAITPAGQDYIDRRNEANLSRAEYCPIVPKNLDYAVKAAMTDGIGAAWTDAERLAALARMGCIVDENGFVKWTATPSQE